MRGRGALVGGVVLVLVVGGIVYWIVSSHQDRSTPTSPPPEERSAYVTDDVTFVCQGMPLQLVSVRVTPSPLLNTWAFDLHCASDEPCTGSAEVSVRYQSDTGDDELQFEWWLAIEAGATVRLSRQQRSEGQIEAIEKVEMRVVPGASNPMAGA